MANTYSQISIHVIFAVKGRENLLHDKFRNDVFKYISGILSNLHQKPLAVGGMPDHVHVFFGMSTDSKLSDIVRDVKANSSRFINENKFVKTKFHWQEGYGAFSYSRSQRDSVIKYIINQEKHHSKKSFKEEYLELLTKFEVEYFNRYLFEWIE